MKKRVLSATLAIAMLASSVGAMNVFAADYKDPAEKFAAYDQVDAKDDIVGTDKLFDTAEITTTAKLNEALDKIYFGDADTSVTVYPGGFYSFDFIVKGGSNGDGKVDAGGITLNNLDLTFAEGDSLMDALQDAVSAAYDADEADISDVISDLGTMFEKFFAEYELGATNSDVTSSFKEFGDLAKALDEADYKDLYFDKDGDGEFDSGDDYTEWTAYNLDGLQKAYTAGINSLGTGAAISLSQQIYLYNAYDVIDGEIGLGRALSWQEKYENLLDEIDNYNEEDYTTASWNSLQTKMNLADVYYAAEEYENAYNTLKGGVDALKVVKPDITALESLLESLFENGTVPTPYAAYAGNTDNHVYKVSNNGGSNPSDAWKACFAESYTDSYGDKYTGAYKAAYEVWYNVKRRSNSDKNTQTKVDEVMEYLEYALSQLSEGSDSENWQIVRLEEMLDKAYDVVETDYRTTRKAWETFQDAVAEAEEVVALSSPSASKIDRAYTNLKAAYAALDSIKLTPPSASKSELKDLLKEAESLLKDTDGKTLNQVDTLKAAQKAADDVYDAYSSQLISKVESVIADLESAIAGYNQKQGWYLDNGTWYYGKEDTVAKGWLNVNGVWYLLDSTTGAMKTGWQQVNGTWYYMNASGAMQTGWLNLNGTYYYLESWGGMATGWKNVNGSWYYLQSSGAMVANGWYWINGKCYYFYNWGGMAANTTINGWTVGADGAWIQ